MRIEFLLLAVIILILPLSTGAYRTEYGDIGPSGSTFDRTQLKVSINLGNGYIDTAPLADEGGIYVLTSGIVNPINGTLMTEPALVKLDYNGNVKWNTKVDGIGYELCTPVLMGESIYVLSSAGMLYRIDRESGAVISSVSIGPGPYTSSLDAHGEYIYTLSPNGTLAVYSPALNLLWSYASFNSTYFSVPCVREMGNTTEVAFGTDDGWFFCLLGNGSLEFSVKLNGTIRGRACSVDDNWLVPVRTKTFSRLYLISRNGTVLDTAVLQGKVCSPVYWSGHAYIGSGRLLYDVTVADNTLDARDILTLNGDCTGPPFIWGDAVAVTSNQNTSGEASSLYVYYMDGRNTEVLVMNPHQWCLSPPTGAGPYIITASDSGYVHIYESVTFPPEAPGIWYYIAILAAFLGSGLLILGVKRSGKKE